MHRDPPRRAARSGIHLPRHLNRAIELIDRGVKLRAPLGKDGYCASGNLLIQELLDIFDVESNAKQP